MLTSSNNVEHDTAANSERALTIAIDGPAGAGKSTVAQLAARQLGYLYIDTGAMYRAATWVALSKKVDLNKTDEVVRLVEQADIQLRQPDESSKGRVRVFVDGEDMTMIVRSRIIGKFVSQIAAIGGVRQILVKKQQEMAANGGVVMDGRDIGTVVLPDANPKIYLTASPDVRAARRVKELKELGQLADQDTIQKEIMARDHLDMTREISPLRQAPDAVAINTDEMTIDQVVSEVLNLSSQRQRR